MTNETKAVADTGTVAAIRELEAQRAAVADTLGSRAAEYARALAVVTAERDELKSGAVDAGIRIAELEKELAELKREQT